MVGGVYAEKKWRFIKTHESDRRHTGGQGLETAAYALVVGNAMENLSKVCVGRTVSSPYQNDSSFKVNLTLPGLARKSSSPTSISKAHHESAESFPPSRRMKSPETKSLYVNWAHRRIQKGTPICSRVIHQRVKESEQQGHKHHCHLPPPP